MTPVALKHRQLTCGVHNEPRPSGHYAQNFVTPCVNHGLLASVVWPDWSGPHSGPYFFLFVHNVRQGAGICCNQTLQKMR